MVWAWFHAEGEEPFYDIPEVPEFDDEAWTPTVVRDFEINLAAQDMAEDNMDCAHFRYVHGTSTTPYEAAVHFRFASMDELGTALASEGTAKVQADVANYTDIENFTQVSQIV